MSLGSNLKPLFVPNLRMKLFRPLLMVLKVNICHKYVPFQGYLMVSGCDSLASLEDSRKWGCVRLMLNLLILALPRGINFPLDLRILSEYGLMTFLMTSQIQNVTFKLKVNWANGFLLVIYKVPLTVDSLVV